MTRNVILDSDTASDDTIAILLASKLFNLVGVTIVSGNIDFDQEVKNALFTLEYFDINAPVFIGSSRPILGIWKTVEEVHGKKGMGKIEYLESSRKAEKEHAVDAIIRLSKEYDNLEILAVSPLTNLALAYLKDPSIVKRIRKVWIMGGAFSRGNTTCIAEFNFWVDPEAVKVILHAGFDITIVPWEVTEKTAVIDDDLWNKIEKLNTRSSNFFISVNSTLREYSKAHGTAGSVQTDSLTVYLAYDNSSILKSKKYFVDIETCSISRGAMLIDFYKNSKRKCNAEIVLEANREKFLQALFNVLSS